MFNSKLKNKLLGLLAGLVLSFSAHAQIFGGSNPILCANGDTVTSPCFAWSLNPRTGFYQPALNQIGVAINGVNVGTWTATGYTGTTNFTAPYFLATGTASSPSATVTATQLAQQRITFVDSAQTANNRLIELLWSSGGLTGRFLNDAYSAATNFLVVNGGQAAGITGITSNSGSGSWVHTGPFAASSSITAANLILSGNTLPTTSSNGTVGINPNQTHGITLQGKGATNDVMLLNNAGAAALLIPTGTTTVAMQGAASVAGNMTVSGTGPHAIGGATDPNYQFILRGTAPTITATGAGFLQLTNATAAAGFDLYGMYIQPTLNKAGSGTHANFVSLLIDPPVIGAGAATLTNSTTFKINGAPTVGTNLRAFWVAAGITETVNHRLTGFTFANIATNLTANGDIGYCSDCTIANPCAGGGTGALGKRLNDVNVCN
jgi:hypothetical protein